MSLKKAVYYASFFRFKKGPLASDVGDFIFELPCTTAPVVVVVLTLTYRYNAVRGHRTCSNNSGGEDWKITSGGKQKKQKILHT